MAWIGLASSLVSLFDIISRALVLAFWVSQAEWGIAMIAVGLFPALDAATDLGILSAVIQRDDHTDDKLSTVFWLNVAMSLVLFALLALVVGPGLATFHGDEIVAGMLTLYGTKLIWQNSYFIPAALLMKELRFKELSVLRIIANCAEFGGIIGFAAAGFGPWCFVAGPLCRVLVTGIGCQILRPWRPKFVFRFGEAKSWVAFGLRTSASKILYYFYTNVDYQIVPYYFGKEAAGLYATAYLLVLEPCRIIGEVITRIGFPVFARLKHHRQKLIEQLIRFTRMSLILIVGFLAIVFIDPEGVLELIFPKYVEAADAARVLCAVGMLRALSFIVPPLLDGVGRPELSLRYNLVATIALPGLFIACANVLSDMGYMSVAIGWAAGYPIAFTVLFAMALAQLELPLRDYLAPLWRIPAAAGAAAVLGAGVKWLAMPLPLLVRVMAVAVSIVIGFFALLALLDGVTPKSVIAALRGDDPAAPESARAEHVADDPDADADGDGDE